MTADPIAVLRASLPTADQQARFDALYTKQAKKQGVANILSLPLLGTFGLQHFYLGKYLSGILSVLFSWTLIPTVVSLFELLSGEVRHEVITTNQQTARRIHSSLITSATPAATSAAPLMPAVAQVAATLSTMTPGAIVEPLVPAPPVPQEPLVPAPQPAIIPEATVASAALPITPHPVEDLKLVSSTAAEIAPDAPVATPPLTDAHHYADAEPLLDNASMSDSGDPADADGVLLFVAEEDPLESIAFTTVATSEAGIIVTSAAEVVVPQQRPVIFDSPPLVAAPTALASDTPYPEVSRLLDVATPATSADRPAHETGWVDVQPLHHSATPAQARIETPPTEPTNVPGGGLGTDNPPTNVPGGGLGTPPTPLPVSEDDPDYRHKPPHLGPAIPQ